MIPAGKQVKKQAVKKVYCRRCAYYVYEIYNDDDKCLAPNNMRIIYKDNYENKNMQIRYVSTPRNKNGGNNCPDFKLSFIRWAWNNLKSVRKEL